MSLQLEDFRVRDVTLRASHCQLRARTVKNIYKLHGIAMNTGCRGGGEGLSKQVALSSMPGIDSCVRYTREDPPFNTPHQAEFFLSF
jgi:hypothetical protein